MKGKHSDERKKARLTDERLVCVRFQLFRYLGHADREDMAWTFIQASMASVARTAMFTMQVTRSFLLFSSLHSSLRSPLTSG